MPAQCPPEDPIPHTTTPAHPSSPPTLTGEFLGRPLHCCAAVQREGTAQRFRVASDPVLGAVPWKAQTRSARHGMVSQFASDPSFLSSFSEQAPDLIESVRRIFQVNDPMTVGA